MRLVLYVRPVRQNMQGAQKLLHARVNLKIVYTVLSRLLVLLSRLFVIMPHLCTQEFPFMMKQYTFLQRSIKVSNQVEFNVLPDTIYIEFNVLPDTIYRSFRRRELSIKTIGANLVYVQYKDC